MSMGRVRVKSFQFAGFSITFEVSTIEGANAARAVVDRIAELPGLEGWRVQRLGSFGCVGGVSAYFEPTTSTPADGPARKTRKAAAKQVARDHGFEVVSESTPIAGQVR